MKNEIATVEMNPGAMIQMAVQGGADLDKLEKLMVLQERWEANEAKKAYNKAMAAFKADPPKINKDRHVRYQTSKGVTEYNHASLSNVTDAINTALSKHGLSASWKTKQNGEIVVTCQITHELGHSEETSISANADASGSKNPIQSIGSTITYLERYTLLALTGLATHEQDDDGQGSVGYETISTDQEIEIQDLLNSKKDPNGDEIKLLKWQGVESIDQIPAKNYSTVITTLRGAKK